MNTARRAQRYDVFKLIVALVLLAVLIYLLLTFNGRAPVAGGSIAASPTAVEQALAAPTSTTAAPAAAATATPVAVDATATSEPTEVASATGTAAPTHPPATATTAPTATDEAAATATPTQAAATATPQAAEATATPEATAEAATPEPSPTPSAEQSGDLAACAALPSRLEIGASAQVLTTLYLRSAPQIAPGNILRAHPSGTVLEVIGGPQCVPYGNSAYLWWEVQNPEGQTGWSAEGSASGQNYFLQPVP